MLLYYLKPSFIFPTSAIDSDRILSKRIINCLQIILSKIFKTKGEILIGLKFSLRLFAPFLKTVLMFAIFKDDGNLNDVIASIQYCS